MCIYGKRKHENIPISFLRGSHFDIGLADYALFGSRAEFGHV